VTSILFGLNLNETRIKAVLGWELSGKSWFTYLRDVTVTPRLAALYKHLTDPLQ
jgi:hypothetical protein